MSACAACGVPAVASLTRFCRSCGAPLDLDAGRHLPGRPADPAPGDRATASDGARVTPVVAVSGTVRRDAPTRWWLVAVAGALAVAAAGVWAVGRAGDATPAASEQESTIPDPATTTSDTVAATTETATTASSTTATTDPAAPLVLTDGAGPVVGHPAGWSVLVGNASEGGGLWRLDLDTGQVVRYRNVDGGPLYAAGDRLLLADGTVSGIGGELRVVPLSDLNGPGIAIELATPGSVVAADPASGGDVWIGDIDAGGWLLVRLADGAVVARVDASLSPDGSQVPGGGPDVITSDSGGVYRREGDGYRLLAPGRPVLVSGGDVLVRSCSSPTSCRLRWVDGETGSPVDRPTPPDADTRLWWQDLMPGSDRFLQILRFPAGSDQPPTLVLYDLEKGRLVEGEGQFFGALAASPDGRYLVVGAEDGLNVYDVEARTWHKVEGPLINYGQMVFVPNG